MNEPTQEELKRFWEKCGFKHFYGDSGEGWIYPDECCYQLLPPLTLDNLFKYGWPQLVKKVGLLKAAELLIKWLDEWANVWKVRKPEAALYHALNKVL